MSVMGVDVGTSSAKVAVVNGEGEFLALAREGYSLLNPRPGRFLLDPAEVFQAVCRLIQAVCAEAAVQKDPVRAISACSLGESFVLMDAENRELNGSPIYLDRSGEEELPRILEFRDGETWRETVGMWPAGQQTLPQLAYLLKERPELSGRAKRLHFLADYVLAKLGAEHVTDGSLAATSMLLRLEGQTWWREALEFLGIDPAILPEVRPAGAEVGTVSPAMARSLGLLANTRLILGGHDQMMCALGAGATRAAVAVNSLGTTDAVTPVVESLDNAAEILGAGFRLAPYSALAGRYCSSVYNLNGGALKRWYCQNLGCAELDGAALEARMPDQPARPVFLPHLSGRREPGKMTGAILGLDYDVRRPEIYKAMLEGQAFEILRGLQRFERAAGRISTLRATGGMARSDAILRIRADVLGRPVARLFHKEAGCLGNALVAGAAVGQWKGVSEAAERLARVEREFVPDRENSQRYQERYARYLEFYRAFN